MSDLGDLAAHWGKIHGEFDQKRFEQKEISLTDAQWQRCAHDASRREALDQRLLDADYPAWQETFEAAYETSVKNQ